MKEEVALSHADNLLGQHFEHVAEHLEYTPFTYTHRAKAALESCADLALHVDKGYSKHSIQRDDDQCHQDALSQNGTPFGKATRLRQKAVKPS